VRHPNPRNVNENKANGDAFRDFLAELFRRAIAEAGNGIRVESRSPSPISWSLLSASRTGGSTLRSTMLLVSLLAELKRSMVPLVHLSPRSNRIVPGWANGVVLEVERGHLRVGNLLTGWIFTRLKDSWHREATTQARE
jgi:hypothetical protein